MPKKTSKPKKESVAQKGIENVSTVFTDRGIWSYVDGREVARNIATFSRMWHINTDIRRCIAEKQETSMKNGYELRRVNKWDKAQKPAEDPDFIDALNKFQTLSEMKDEIIMYLDLFGDVYIRKRFNAFRNVAGYTGSKVMGYEVLDTRTVNIITDSDLNPLRYLYQRKASTAFINEVFLPEEILHFRNGKNFDNPLFGTTIMETLVLDVMGDDQASLTNYFWFQNDAIPSALYILKPDIGDEDAKAAVERIREKLSGGHNKGKEIVSNAITDIKPITQKHNDADFLEQRKFTTQRVCAAFGVPRTILGYIEDVNHSNGDSQYKKFIENTIIPLEKKLEFIFTTLGQDFGKFKFCINDEHIDQIEQRSKLAQDNVKAGIWTINEAREYIGNDQSEDELANELMVASNIQLLSNLLVGDPAPTPTDQLPTQI